MWTCLLCEERIEDDSWEHCWKCGSSRDITSEEAAALKERSTRLRKQFLTCQRCESRMEFAGSRSFHEGAKLGFWFGDWGEFFINREHFDIFACKRCGKVEFYLDGVGEDLRTDPADPTAHEP